MTSIYKDKPDRILAYIRALRRRGDPPPTIREIRDACGVSSTSMVFFYLRKLRKRGAITWDEGKARTIRLAEPDYLFKIDLDWIPPAETRGNTREHHIALWRQRRELMDRGVEYGHVAQTEYPDNVYPITGALAVEITAWNPKRIDWDNLAIGYKSFIDGLQTVTGRDRWGFETLGAGVIEDDKQIVEATIRVKIGPERSELIYRRAT